MVVLLHHLKNSRSQTIIWLLEEMGVEYQLEKHTRKANGLAPPSLEKVHPLGKAPVIIDDGKVIAETAVIIEYLVKKYRSPLGPPENEDLALMYSYWMYFAEGSGMPSLVMAILLKGAEAKTPFLIRPVAKLITGGLTKAFVGPNIRRQAAFMDQELAKNPQNWFVKDFSAADIMMSFPAISTQNYYGSLAKYPHLEKYLAQVRERPAYKKAMQKAEGEFSM